MKKNESILQDDMTHCYFCPCQYGLEYHHIYAGVANRKISDANHFGVMLCKEHHTGKNGAQYNKELNTLLKQRCQEKYEETHTREEFRKLIGKSYL